MNQYQQYESLFEISKWNIWQIFLFVIIWLEDSVREKRNTHFVVESGIDNPTISIWPLIGRPYVCPEAPKKTPVSTCFIITVLSLCQKSPSQTIVHTSPVSPSPSSPNADTSWAFDKGEPKWWECKFRLVVVCSNRTSWPHSTGAPRTHCFLGVGPKQDLSSNMNHSVSCQLLFYHLWLPNENSHPL